eukprot:TRINITY_DN22498_c0_g1_i1.p1 TRINITY_DN22498_c0_g1~~TRINITY_DN22498_c0_g1_i1.p1  ORF type:complete len:323 (-),score=70.24 TRINITY_DN22498_c0_g1_i1:47-889(-)
MVGLPAIVVIDLANSAETFWNLSYTRGPKPTVVKLAKLLNIPANTLGDAIDRIRPILFQTLKNRWWNDRVRPSYDLNSIFPDVGLIVDSTSLQIFKPLEYFHNANSPNTWSILMDKGYTGPQGDTPEVRRIVPHKGNTLSPNQIRDNNEIKKKRVWVECFFGKMCLSWNFVKKPYPFDNKKFDLDYDNIILLTNETIKHQNYLALNDRLVYIRFMVDKIENFKSKRKRKNEQNRAYRINHQLTQEAYEALYEQYRNAMEQDELMEEFSNFHEEPFLSILI